MRRFAVLLLATSLPPVAFAQESLPTVETLNVTAAPYPLSVRAATSSVVVVGREALERGPQAGLGDALAGLPGLRSSHYGPGASRPVIRGMSGPRVTVLQNGLGQIDASTLSPDHAVASDPAEAQLIEIVRGPAALAYGGSAIGGAVNVVDDRIATVPLANSSEGRISAAYGVNGRADSVSAGFKTMLGPLVVSLDGARRRSSDYEAAQTPVSDQYAAGLGETPLPGERVLNTDLALDAYGLGVSYVGNSGFAGIALKRDDSAYGVPFAQITGPDQEMVRIHLRQTRADVRGERLFQEGPIARLKLSAARAKYRHAEIEVDTGAVGTRFLSNGGEGRFEAVQRQLGPWQGGSGVTYAKRSLAALGDEAFIPSSQIEEVAIFTQQRLDLGGYGAEGGLRLDRRSLSAELSGRTSSPAALGHGIDWTTAPGRRVFEGASGSAAIFWRPRPELFASLSLSRASRAPTEFELYSDGPHAGEGLYQIGDPNLGAETATSGEAALRWKGVRLTLEARLFQARYAGFIDQRPTGEMVDDDGGPDPDGLPVRRFVQTSARFTGGELTAAYGLGQLAGGDITLHGSADWVRAQTALGPAARTPPWSATVGLEWRSARADVHLEARRVGAQHRLAAFETATDGYTVLNVRLGWRPNPEKGLALYLDASNLTDQLGREHVSPLKDIAPLPGRNLRLGVSWRG